MDRYRSIRSTVVDNGWAICTCLLALVSIVMQAMSRHETRSRATEVSGGATINRDEPPWPERGGSNEIDRHQHSAATTSATNAFSAALAQADRLDKERAAEVAAAAVNAARTAEEAVVVAASLAAEAAANVRSARASASAAEAVDVARTAALARSSIEHQAEDMAAIVMAAAETAAASLAAIAAAAHDSDAAAVASQLAETVMAAARALAEQTAAEAAHVARAVATAAQRVADMEAIAVVEAEVQVAVAAGSVRRCRSNDGRADRGTHSGRSGREPGADIRRARSARYRAGLGTATGLVPFSVARRRQRDRQFRRSDRPASRRLHCGIGRPSGHSSTGVQSGPPVLVRVIEHACGHPAGESSQSS